MEKELMCVCGDSEAMHVDGSEQCFVVDCGCREFVEACSHPNLEHDKNGREVCSDCGKTFYVEENYESEAH